jgi:uncharacterized membrane-anchored protein YitT (DUF2179 family)
MQAQHALSPMRRLMPRTIPWRTIQRLLLVIGGSIIGAFGYSLFLIPFNLAAGGLTGIGIIINYLTGWPAGATLFVLNLPLLVLGFFYLGRWRFVRYTLLAALVFSVATDLFIWYLPQVLGAPSITTDLLLAAIYAAIVTGIGSGLVYRAGANPGGTAILSRIIQLKTGIPLGQIYLYTDGAIVLVAGAVFGWETALLALLVLFLSGIASDFVLEGPSTVRMITIITHQPEELSQALMRRLGRGVSFWPVTGAYTGQEHTLLLCTVYRPQVSELKLIVAEIDPKAFVVIGNAHQAFGTQFSALKR